MAHSFNVFYLFPLQTGVSLLPTLLFVEEDMSTRYSKSLTFKFKTILYIYILLRGIYLPKKRKKNIPNIFVRSLGFLENTVVFGSSKSQILVELIRSECIYLEAKHKFSKNCSEMTGQYRVVMVRHGESEWNLKNQFTGWYDSKLSETGKKESIACGEAIKKSGLKFDVAHTSVLLRAHETLCPILDIIQQKDIPIFQTWRLNERHYGGLTGLNKAETAAKYGEEQVKIWRRSYDTPPPPMEPNHPFYDCIVNDPRYADGPKKEEFPMFESLKLTIQRTLPYWNDVIIPHLKEGKRVLIVAHGNSLRGIVKHLDNMSEEAIMTLNLPTGIPFVYELDENFKPVVSMKFLGDEETVKKAMEAVAAQGKAK